MVSNTERANAIRVLAMDAVEQAKSGHPGAPMGLADAAEVLWREFLHHNPGDSAWPNRDRFVLSNGHGSMLLYSLLHLTGYPVSLDDIKNFRQLHSPTAGHPEWGECPGVETTTGPLGQGLANAVGMAMAERSLARTFNRDGFEVVDHRTWVIAGDGCLMEGISHEAASLAGTLALGKLICLYDDNGISIDGRVDAWFGEDVPARFEAYGWRVIREVDGHDAEAVRAALAEATQSDGRPTLVCVRTLIGFGAPNKQDSAAAHGSALGADEVALARKTLNWGFEEPFFVPEEIYASWDLRARGQELQAAWQAQVDGYSQAHPKLAAELERRWSGRLPEGWCSAIDELAERAQAEMKDLETRKSSQACIGALASTIPELLGGSADLTGSNGTQWSGAEADRYMNFGVREFGMSAVCNGMALHGGVLPFSGTFLVFMEYARNAVRLASLMGIRNIFVYTHDSVAVGEDGPTHQPVEQLTNLRTTPGLSTWRPCDTVETAFAWRAAIASGGPTALVFTRQKTPAQARDAKQFAAIAKGGYVLWESAGQPEVVLLATGSEVSVALEAGQVLDGSGVRARVVSMPSTDVFLAQDEAYRDAVLPPDLRARVAVEAAHPDYWYRFVGLDGAVVGINRFGVSAPGDQAMTAMGISVDAVVDAARLVVRSV